MLSGKLNGYRGDGAGASWPDSPSAHGVVRDVMGPRPFNAHIATVGYDYDFHRGIDLDANPGDPLYSPISGSIIRRHYPCFGFQDAAQLNEFTLTTPSSSLAVALSSNLVLTCSRVGAVSFPSGIDTYAMSKVRLNIEEGDYWLEIEMASAPSISSGALGIGIFNAAKTEYICLEYDGATFTKRGVGTTTFTANGGTHAVASKTWWRIKYTQTTGTWSWDHSTDGSTWTSMATEASRDFTSAAPDMIPMMYWRSGDTNATPFTLNVSQFCLHDTGQSIGRFGNWLEIADATRKFCMMHFRTLVVDFGHVQVGQLLGYAGSTGYDERSGRVLSEHCHFEYHANNKATYSNNDAINPLDPLAGLPRVNVSNNVAVVRATANDPDTVDSWRLTITVTRQDSDFDINEISLTGNSATRTVNFNTRAGLNADVDIPKQSGVYIVPQTFDENSATYVVAIYFNKATVGSTFTSAYVKDTQGTTLWSE